MNDTLPFGIFSKSSYIDTRKINIICYAIFDAEYKPLEIKALTPLKMPLFSSFFKYITEEELSEEKLLEYIKLNKNKARNDWIDEYKKMAKKLRDSVSQKCMIKER